MDYSEYRSALEVPLVMDEKGMKNIADAASIISDVVFDFFPGAGPILGTVRDRALEYIHGNIEFFEYDRIFTKKIADKLHIDDYDKVRTIAGDVLSLTNCARYDDANFEDDLFVRNNYETTRIARLMIKKSDLYHDLNTSEESEVVKAIQFILAAYLLHWTEQPEFPMELLRKILSCKEGISDLNSRVLKLEQNKTSDVFEKQTDYEFECENLTESNQSLSTNPLSTVVDTQNQFQTIVSNLLNPDNSDKPLSYDSSSVFVGRRKELAALGGFCENNKQFLFWVICGPGGVGKNKLAYYFFKDYENKEAWDYKFIDSDSVQLFSSLSEWSCTKNTCLIYDDADMNSTPLCEWFKKLLSRPYKGLAKLRVLMLARGNRNDEIGSGKTDWFNPFIESSIPIRQYWYEEKFLYLDDLSEWECLDLVRQYYVEKKQRVPTSEEMKDFYNIFHRRTKGDKTYRALFVLALIESYLVRPINVEEFNIPMIYQRIYERNCRVWSGKIHDKDVYGALKSLYAYVTIVGEWKRTEKLPGFLQNEEDILFRTARRATDNLFEKWFGILSDAPNDGNVLQKYSPDLLGEFFSLKVMQDLSNKELTTWLQYMIHDENAIAFLCRIIQDFGEESTFEDFVKHIILCLISIMKTDEENLVVARITSLYFSKYSFYMSEKIRRELSDREENIFNHYCWTEVYVKYILDIYEDRTLTYLSQAYDTMMTICDSWNMYETPYLASKALTMLGELVRYTIAVFSTEESDVIRENLVKYWSDFVRIKEQADRDNEMVQESLVSSESRMLEATYMISNHRIETSLISEEVTQMILSLKDSMILHIDCFSRNQSREFVMNKLIENLRRIIVSQCKSGVYDYNWLSKLLECEKKMQNQMIIRIGIPTLIRIAISICVDQSYPSQNDIDAIFSFIGEQRGRLERENISPLDVYHIDSIINKYFSTNLIPEIIRTEAYSIFDMEYTKQIAYLQ